MELIYTGIVSKFFYKQYGWSTFCIRRQISFQSMTKFSRAGIIYLAFMSENIILQVPKNMVVRDNYYFDGVEKTMEKNPAIFIQYGYTYVPVRFICVVYGIQVYYKGNTNHKLSFCSPSLQ